MCQPTTSDGWFPCASVGASAAASKSPMSASTPIATSVTAADGRASNTRRASAAASAARPSCNAVWARAAWTAGWSGASMTLAPDASRRSATPGAAANAPLRAGSSLGAPRWRNRARACSVGGCRGSASASRISSGLAFEVMQTSLGGRPQPGPLEPSDDLLALRSRLHPHPAPASAVRGVRPHPHQGHCAKEPAGLAQVVAAPDGATLPPRVTAFN